MATLVGFGTFAALPEEQISEKVSRRILSGDQGMIVWWSIGAGIHVEPHSHPNEQIVWMLKGRMEFRLGTERRVCGQGDVVVIPGGAEHEAWFREDTEVIDFFAPPRDDFLIGNSSLRLFTRDGLIVAVARPIGRCASRPHMHEAGIEPARCRGDMALPVDGIGARSRLGRLATAIGSARWRPPMFGNVYSPKAPQIARRLGPPRCK
jgi:quercetin dioxygenase-like cupin family protein